MLFTGTAAVCQHTRVVTCLTGQDNETQMAFCAVLALKAVPLQGIVRGLVSTELVPFTAEGGYRARVRFSALYQVSEQVTIHVKQDSSGGICSKTLHKMPTNRCFPGRIF